MTLLTGTISCFIKEAKEVKATIVENKRNKPLEDKYKLKNLFETYNLKNPDGSAQPLAGYMLTNNIYTLYISPTANCQTCSIGGFQGIFEYPDSINWLLHNVYEVTRKKLIIIDIRQDYLCYFDEQIDDDMVMSKSLYDSTNGSKMALIMLNISKLVPRPTLG